MYLLIIANYSHNMKPLNNTFLFLFYILLQGTLLPVHTHSIPASRLGNETDQLALLDFKSRLASNEILNTWNNSVPHCQWPGVTCGHKHHRVTALDLTGYSLFGPISPHLGNISFLQHINLTTNRLNGEMPQEIGRLSRLKYLNVAYNTIEGAIPVNLSYCTELIHLILWKNNLTGEIPTGLGSLKKLVILGLTSNKLNREIPSSLGNLSSLQYFDLGDNSLQGNIPNELSKLTNLVQFTIALNNLSGDFPPSLFNISSITHISTAVNPISGSLPTDIGFTLPNLSWFGFGGNLFTGIIPKSIANASQLTLIDFGRNNFVGSVPHSLGSLPNLHILKLWGNQLGGDSMHDLSFLGPLSNCSNLKILGFDNNNMIGKLPDSIANLSVHLEELYMGNNKIYGTIPESIGNLVNLYIISIEYNKLSGSIPNSLGRLKRLQIITLFRNLLSGEIPSSLGDLNELTDLDLSANKLNGNIPESIGNCERLHFLNLSNNNLYGSIPPRVMAIASLSIFVDLSHNLLSGPLPLEIGKLVSLNKLDISNNNLSGEIPNTIVNCLSLEYLSISGNSFRGSIPYTLDNLKGIKYLDFSRNNLSGKIPGGIENLTYLQYLNLSFNDLEGEIPIIGVFGNVSAISLSGNSRLCGGVPGLKLPLCPNIKANKNNKLTIALVCVAMFLFAIALFGVLYWRSKKLAVPIPSLKKEKFLRISHLEFHRATNGFSSENLIGSGGFGTVYKGKINPQVHELVAVKVLNLQNNGASKSFVTECKILRSIRHRNLVKILTYCSSIDSRHDEFKALVYEYMPNGNLDIWLHPDEKSTSTTLNLLQRLNIAIDIASALDYLHNNCEPLVIHCDLKPSNILLDVEMCAHVGDFGLARFLQKKNGVISETSSIGVKGTIGYAAPEYGIGGEISTRGDVYAYGILLLEMITGRRPTDDFFKDDFNLHNYVKSALSGQVFEIVDPTLHNETGAQGEVERRENEMVEMNYRGPIESTPHHEFEKNIIAILSIALACSEESPTNRIDMKYVTRELHGVKGAMLANGRNKL